MSLGKKLSLIGLFLLLAYCAAWITAYRQSSAYFEYAQEQMQQGEWVTALKGMNKLELRLEDPYLGGYQQVIETWESSLLGPRPGFYQQAITAASEVLPKLSDAELLKFIDIYVQLDLRYVPEAAVELQERARQNGDEQLATEMTEFLTEAFPEFTHH
ncbi:hypothetical protein [Endozoicomonas elysicola]|uniref:Uncharacterized protein n=1 Tax=Endozoicomonas elysicola TaxID=305900 RepID=A0A081KBG8_9GAMM|nr:hypothetical protein [Endozoicomonas elysicola]KEI71494.1 hypothetical protein GV64_12735 [Endozoicomonas elysicola]